MKKKVLVISAIAFAVILLVSVALFVLPSLNIGRVDGNLKLEKGVLLWDDIPNAAGYEVDLGSGGIPVSDNQYDLAANCAYSGELSVTVRAIQKNNSRMDIGNMDIAVNKLPQPIVSVEGEGEEVCFVWSAVENATGYTYDAHDGKGTVSAVADEDGRYRVNVSNLEEQMIHVTALGGSADGVVYAANDCLYRYSSSRVFDLALIAEHPAVYYATGSLGVEEYAKVGTGLPKGTYKMTVTLYASTVSGDKLKGNGTWGRRIVDNGNPRVHLWMCEDAPSADWPDAGGTIPYPDEVVTVDLLVRVDINSNALIPCYDFDEGDMVVIKDLVMDGKSVLNDRNGEPNPEMVIDPFNLSTLDNYLAYYKGSGEWMARDQSNYSDFVLRVPTRLRDGAYCVQVNYYVCGPNGEMLTGNGLWGRRVSAKGVKTDDMCWLIEYDVDQYKATDIPFPTARKSHIFEVDVKNGYIELEFYDFNEGEYFIVESVTQAPPVAGGFDLRTVNNYLASYRGTGEWLTRDRSNIRDFALRIPTDLQDGEQAVTVNYYVCNSRGGKLTGNGLWGRRVLPDVEKDTNVLWLNEKTVDKYPAVALSNPTQLSSFTVDVEVKDGYIELYCLDFDKGDYIIVESVTAAKPLEGGFDLSTLDSYLASYRGTGQWLARDRSNIEEFALKIPADLNDGFHTVKINYHVCNSRGGQLSGNGLWGRRVLPDVEKDTNVLWLNEEKVNDYSPVVLPAPTQLNSFTVDAEVKDGYIKLYCLDFDNGDYIIVESVEATAEPMTIETLTFADGNNGFVFEAKSEADLKVLTGKALQMTVQYQFAQTTAQDAVNAQLADVTASVAVDENGKLSLRLENEAYGVKLVIPAGTVITAPDDPATQITIGKEVTLERDAAYWGTNSGWQQSVYTDITLNFRDASNGYAFQAESAKNLVQTYGAWKKLNVTVQVQKGSSAEEAKNAELTQVQAFFNLDEKGSMLLYGADEYRGVKLVIPAGTVITPDQQALCQDKLRITNDIVLVRNSANWGTNAAWQQIVCHDAKLSFVDTSNGFVFDGETTANLKALYEAGAEFTLEAKFQYSQMPDEHTVLEDAVDVTVSVTLDENGRLCLHPEQEEMGIQLMIPKGTVITPVDLSLCNVHLELTEDVVLARDVSNVGTKDGWKQILFADVTLNFKDASNGYIFDVSFAEDEKKFDLIEAYGTWANNKLELTVQSQFGTNASTAEAALLKELAAFFNVDDDGRLCLYGANEYVGIKLVIPAGTMVTPTNPEKSDVRLRIKDEIVLERVSSNFGTANGWQIATGTEPEPEPENYVDVKLSYKNASNGLVFTVECTEDLKSTYGAWKNLNVTVQRKFSKISAQEALDAQLENVNAVFNVDDNGYLCLYNSGDVGCVEILIPAGTIITPSDKALSDKPLRITDDVVLVRENTYWMTSGGWIQQETK